MDYKKTQETKTQINKFNTRLNILEELHKETIKQIKEIQDNCNHDLIFINKKYKNKEHDYLQYGKCLICEKGITLTPNNVNISNQEVVDETKIINIAEKVEDFIIACDCTENKSDLEIAQNVFNSLFSSNYCLRFKERAKYEIDEAIKRKNLIKK